VKTITKFNRIPKGGKHNKKGNEYKTEDERNLYAPVSHQALPSNGQRHHVPSVEQ
jgi:hypothetical protein